MNPRIGTVDIPGRLDRGKYFRELSYLELSVLYAGPLKPSTLQSWTDTAPADTVGLVAPFSLTHRKPPTSTKLWPHDASTGDFRDSATSRETLAPLRAAIDALHARSVIFRSPESFSASAANREALHRFFGEIATTEALGVERVWIPGGLWDLRTAIKLAGELGITCAFDPMVRAPGEPLEVFYDLDVEAVQMRITGGRTGAIRGDRMEDLAMLVEHYATVPTTVVFASEERWQDARNFKKLLSELE